MFDKALNMSFSNGVQVDICRYLPELHLKKTYLGPHQPSMLEHFCKHCENRSTLTLSWIML